jgi:hypothetical protein
VKGVSQFFQSFIVDIDIDIDIDGDIDIDTYTDIMIIIDRY